MHQLIRSRRAQAMVEFSLLAPVFFLLLFGVIDLGRAGFYFVLGSDLARQGARYASNYGNTGTGISDAQVAFQVQQQASAAAIGTFDIPAGCGTSTPPQPPAALSVCQKPVVGEMHFFIEDVAACPACIPATPHYKKVSTVYAFRPATPMLSNITGTIYIVATAAMTTEY
ncbi:MAG: pilus assembly protein [Chloroflexi bacterium]|nr:MAG: pilus assembly protein [Chloroflexota bacterium]